MAQILLVDDSSTVRNEVGKFLESQGLTVSYAVDGVDGLNKLKADPGVKLVLCDVNMPNKDGLTMVEEVRSVLKNNSVHILMLTTESSPVMKERGKAAGLKGWIVKPFNGPTTIGAIKKLVGV